jgi:putative SOS response-associated peptidase YedK
MCGRYTLTADANILQKAFDLQSIPADYAPRYNIAPTQSVYAIKTQANRQLEALQWGLIPSWAKDASIGSKLINARSETVSEKPSFRSAFKARRCLIPATGFYEWQKIGKQKKPHYIYMQDQAVFAMAGLWETWQDATGQQRETCTIITTEPNDLIRPLHHRMAVIVPPKDYDLWLDPNASTQELATLFEPYPASKMALHEVSTAVNNVTNESSELIEPYSSASQKSLF